MMNRFKIKKGTVLTLVFWSFVIGLVVYQNGWLVTLKTPSVQEKLIQKKKETKIVEKKVKSKKKRRIASKIYLPAQQVVEKREEKIIEDVNKQPDRKPETPIERKEHLAFREPPLPGNAEKKEKGVPEIPSVQPEVEPENTVHNKVEKSTAKQVSLPAKREMAKESVETEKRFDFTDYTSNLINNYGIREGEQVPLLLIDDHDNNELYKEGLQFYGYRIIARPKVRPEKPYYFIINNLGMNRIDEVCPYTGLFPSVLQEDHKLFKRLLYQPQFAEMTDRQYELFYAPLDLRMMVILESKLKLIIEEVRLTANEISRMTGTFKRIGTSYILIIESIVTVKGKSIKVHDPDNKIVTVGAIHELPLQSDTKTS